MNQILFRYISWAASEPKPLDRGHREVKKKEEEEEERLLAFKLINKWSYIHGHDRWVKYSPHNNVLLNLF